MAIKAKPRLRIRILETVGHLPREISRFCFYFVNYGGQLEGRVRNPRYRQSPIPSGGLEIPIRLIVRKQNADYRVFQKMKNVVEEYYMEPEIIPVAPSSQTEDEQEDEFGPDDVVEDDVEEIEIFDEDDVMDFVNENDETGIIVIDD